MAVTRLTDCTAIELALANDPGLLAEEYDVQAQRLAGNFPQALSHLAVVKTALLLSGTAKGHRSARRHA